ncbi:hypothetical protein F4775DRAFT_531484 [Biscogniauxia sp. FL1348]|nr:hypothetical protein F4775DRAFT_531484 [Biscogniauxia sp. FL1348]
MECRKAASFSHSTGSSDRYKWDPETVLGLINPLKDSITCVGHAISRGRRCQNRVAAASVRYARNVIDKLALESAYKAAASPQLEVAASLLLCRQFHSGQAPDVAERWRFKLEDWAERHEDVKPSFQADDEESDSDTSDTAAEDSDSDDSDDSDDSGDDDDIKPKVENERKKDPDEKCSNQELMEMMKQMQRSLTWIDAELRKRNAKSDAEVKAKIKLEEEALKQKREQERRRREEAAAAAAAAAAEAAAAEAEAEAARVRAFQERVRRTRQRWERGQNERAERDAAVWRAAWERYNKTWDSDRLSAANIPWPVKLGFRWQVSEANVKLFFAKAPPEESRATARARFDLISKELRRWHTDKVMQHLGLEVVNSVSGEALNTVAKVLVQLRQDAQREMKTG